jgi:hypothetical protein
MAFSTAISAVKARFEQSVKEIGELKPDGPVKPSTDDKLMVSTLPCVAKVSY